MNFEMMKAIWDTQNHERLYAVNEAGLRTMLLRRSRERGRAIFWQEFREIGFGVVAAVLFLAYGGVLLAGEPHRLAEWFNVQAPPTSLDLVALFAAAALWLQYAVWQVAGRKRQQCREGRFEASLRGDLEREIDRADYQVRRTQSVVWWGLLPVWTGTFLFLFVTTRLLHLPGWIVLGLAIVLLVLATMDFRSKRRPIESELMPWKRELESLRTKLES